METKRVILGANPGLTHLPEIPSMCERDRTIYKTEMKVLMLWPDKRPTAIRWLNEVLPHLVPTVMPDLLRKAFWEMPPGSWWEFDCHRKTLSFCYLEKK